MISPFLAPLLPESPVSPLLFPCPPTHPCPLLRSGFAEYCFTESFQNQGPLLLSSCISFDVWIMFCVFQFSRLITTY